MKRKYPDAPTTQAKLRKIAVFDLIEQEQDWSSQIQEKSLSGGIPVPLISAYFNPTGVDPQTEKSIRCADILVQGQNAEVKIS